MNELTQILQSAQTALMSVHWILAVAVLALAPFFTVLAVRKLLPGAWLFVESHMPENKSLRRISLGALVAVPTAALGVLGAGKDPTVAGLAVFASIWAPVLHHLLKAVPWFPYLGSVAEKSSKVPPTLLVVVLCLGTSGCANMLRVVKTADDAARVACSIFFSEHQGITVRDAAKMYCDTREALDVFLASQEQAGEEMAAAQGLARK